MISLAPWGIRNTTAADALLHAEEGPLMKDEFFAGAIELLYRLREPIQFEVIPRLAEYPGTWHPTGFMVYPLGTHSRFGTLRCHIWPVGLRNRVLQGRGALGDIHDGDIHNHSWHVASIALSYYRDNIYTVNPHTPTSRTSIATPSVNEYRIFDVRYSEDAHQTLTNNGRRVIAIATEEREIPAGDSHTIDAMVFHAPTIPSETLGATLVFSSPRVVRTGPHVLIGGLSAPVMGNRRPITPDETVLARHQLMNLALA